MSDDILELKQTIENMERQLREHRTYVEANYVTRSMLKTEMNRLATDIVRQVSAQLQAMVNDAMDEVTQLAVQKYMTSDGAEQAFKRIHKAAMGEFFESDEAVTRIGEVISIRESQEREEMRQRLANMARWLKVGMATLVVLIQLILGILTIGNFV